MKGMILLLIIIMSVVAILALKDANSAPGASCNWDTDCDFGEICVTIEDAPGRPAICIPR